MDAEASVIPLDYLTVGCTCELARCLDIHNWNGNDWRSLAEEFGCNARDIDHIDSCQARVNNGSCTAALFKNNFTRDKTFGQLYEALIKLGRRDAVSILDKYITEIKARWQKRQQREQQESQERESSVRATMAGASVYSLHPSVTRSPLMSNMCSTMDPTMNSVKATAGGPIAGQCDVEMQELSSPLISRETTISNRLAAPFYEACTRGELGYDSNTDFGSLAVQQPVQMMMNESVKEEDTLSSVCDIESKQKVEDWWSANSQYLVPKFGSSVTAGKHKNSQNDETEPPNKIVSSQKFQDTPDEENSSGRIQMHCVPKNIDFDFSFEQWGRFCKLTKDERKNLLENHNLLATFLKKKTTSKGKQLTSSKSIKEAFHSYPFAVQNNIEEPERHNSDPCKIESAGSLVKRKSWPPIKNRNSDKPEANRPVVRDAYQKALKEKTITKISHQNTETDIEDVTNQVKRMSVSVPDDLKPTAYRKGSRGIKVFITYSQDSRKHTQRVLALCDCLRSNNFQPCIDIYEKVAIQQDKYGWLDSKYKEADFVFVVISPRYKQDADNCDIFQPGEELTYHGLHTRYIHRQMQEEYVRNKSQNLRFIPLVFESSGGNRDHVPTWMHSTTVYSWPRQYKDVFFHITRPEHSFRRPKRRSQRSPPYIITQPHNGRVTHSS